MDLLDGYFYAADPYPTYAWHRANDPVHWDDTNGLWGIFRHADVLAIEKQPARYSSLGSSRPLTDYRASMINKDDPEHHDQRSMVSRQFTPRAVRQLEDRVRTICAALLDAVVARGHGDVVADLAAPLPAIVIADKLGFDEALWPTVSRWSELTMQLGGGPSHTTVAGRRAAGEYHLAMTDLIARRRAEPADDLVSAWLDRGMDHEEIGHEGLLLLNGGTDTTRSVIAGGTLAFLQHADQWEAVLDDPGILGATGVEELIRWVTPISNMARTVTEDHELHGRPLRAGEQVLLLYGSANRDEAVFDDPERFDVRREHNHHVAFGFGTHFCLGASLARLELRVMFEELAARLPDLELEPYADPTIQPSAFARGLRSLRVQVAPTS